MTDIREYIALADVHAIIDEGLVAPVFQPIVDLVSGDTVGFEALARGPAGSALHTPGALFAAAREAGREVDLDWACRAAAYSGALAADPLGDLPLFVNSEPVTFGSTCPSHLQAVVDAASRRLRIVGEVTERTVARDPHALLTATETARAHGLPVAMDDVGVEPASLALLPFVDPDVIKLDMSLIQGVPSRATARVVHAVQAHAERSGALILAEGIETLEHLRTARLFGARLGQGWYFGRPAAPPRQRLRVTARNPLDGLVARRGHGAPTDGRTPFEIAATARAVTRGSKDQLVPTSILLEERVLSEAEPAVLLTCFQDVVHLTPRTRERYAALAARSPFVAAIGRGLAAEPVPGVRGADLGAGDPMRDEWNVIVVGPHFAAALLAREVHPEQRDHRRDGEREFDMVLTHDRDLVITAARSMIQWVAPAVR